MTEVTTSLSGTGGATGADVAGGRSVRREYELTAPPDGSSWTDRENLTDVIRREFLGPAHADDELLEAQPDALYLVGRIAPAKLQATREAVATVDPADTDGEPADIETVPAGDADEGRGVPVAPGEPDASEDDEGIEDAPIRRGLMIPSSMGLRFQVSPETAAVTVRASWGTYKSEPTDEVTRSGRPVRRFRRTPHEHPVQVPVGSLSPGTTHDFPLDGSVILRVDVMDQPAEPGGGSPRRIVEVALCNDAVTPRKIPIDAWLYQTALHVEGAGPDAGRSVFLPVTDVLEDPHMDPEPELARLQLQYRDRLQFAIGRTCSVDWAPPDPATRRTSLVRTEWLPSSETPQTRPQEIPGALLDMEALATADTKTLDAGLRPIVVGYREWLATQAAEAATLPAHLQPTADDALTDARRAAKQLEAGLDHLLSDEEALRCFRFMNRVMADQRIQSQVAALRSGQPALGLTEARVKVLAEGPVAHSWRTFQLAFVLMQVEALARPEIPRRSGEAAKAELLFFPTGGGKTEAYLGLAAFTFAVRRRAGVVEGAEGRIDGSSGVAVLMRYTLRLLTAQQFQRATALVCAAEVARRKDPAMWGAEPFRIGLWVGTAVSPKRYDEAVKQLEDAHAMGRKYGLTVLQLQRCPWCGTPIDATDVRADNVVQRVFVYCGDDFGDCPFSRGGAPAGLDEGLPVLTVDEEIYRLAPAFLIATVDKFARLAREGHAASLFGYVSNRCDRHGYVHPDYQVCELKPGGSHPGKAEHPAARRRAVDRLRPPDLIIQDELHLITGALGTAVGAFELAVEVLSTWTDASGATVRPLVVASTATVRNAADQIRSLYGRGVTIFPPQVLDVTDTYFSREVKVSRDAPGRRYLGVSTTGVRLTSAEIVVASTLLSAGQLLLDRAVLVDDEPISTDPYLTLVGYFNATRELAGMARYLADDVQTAIRKHRAGKYFPLRFGADAGHLHIAELTSRVASTEITTTLDQMAVTFDPAWDSSTGRRARAEEAAAAKKADEQPGYRPTKPFDVVLATSMLQVGVDVTRLGLMLMVGQPKNTAEYIQASSRVGRDADRPGLVVTLGNWARPRDLAHYEQFRHYHETFYSQVEPLSVTPYSLTSLDRSLDGVLVSAARVMDAVREGGLSPEAAAGSIDDALPRVETLVTQIVARARVAGGDDAAEAVRNRLAGRVDNWVKRRIYVAQTHRKLVYERVRDGSKQAPLLLSPESSRAGEAGGPPFVVANSMREVQPEINLLVSPDKNKLVSVRALANDWVLDTRAKNEDDDD